MERPRVQDNDCKCAISPTTARARELIGGAEPPYFPSGLHSPVITSWRVGSNLSRTARSKTSVQSSNGYRHDDEPPPAARRQKEGADEKG
ncbi:hypothetical protein D4764_13G0005730 [Takifugu flavidus]|uniref:Uncharacterized protein n=1 Tax=Takifugu flavidus TaxID=433684 RepID=A0A5C6PAV2_9TELE|nr:hypothetical protein D4764_13G0005730 [Takifugu flavidus]